ncbi:MAG: hypothetical protein ACTJHL_09420 [Neisseriaceae bacterium]
MISNEPDIQLWIVKHNAEFTKKIIRGKANNRSDTQPQSHAS